MTKKHKRSPYEDPCEASGVVVKAAKLPRSRQATEKPTIRHADQDVAGQESVAYRSNNGVESGKSTASLKPVAPERMSIETLEQKKMLLPYLDKIEYINVQLRQRGLLVDESTPSPALPVVALGMSTNTGPKRSFVEPSMPPGKSSRPQKSPPTKSSHSTILDAAASHGKSHNQENSSTPTGITHQRSESFLHVAEETPSLKRVKIATDTLRHRYPRLSGSIDRARLAAMAPRLRPINWLLRLIEEMYDELTETFILGVNIGATGRDKAGIDGSPRPEISDATLLGDERPKADHNRSQSRLFQAALVMPFLVRRHLEKTLGLAHLADQDCIDLMYNMEITLDQFAAVAMFSMFVREIYDDDTLLFYLFVRHLVQREFDLQFKAKTKLAHSSTTGKKYIGGEMVNLVTHPLVPDGTKSVLLTRFGCELVWRRYFTHAAEMKAYGVETVGNRSPASPVVLSRFVTSERMADLFDAQDQAAVEHLLVCSVDAFRNVAEDIVAQFKYKDDGESLNGLLRLRETISSDAKISRLMTMFSERERDLRKMRIELLRLERSNTDDNRNRTQLRLLRNQIGLLEQDLEHLQSQISTTEALVNDVWKEVVATSPTKAKERHQTLNDSVTTEYANGSKELPSVLGRFAVHISRLQRKHDIEVKAASTLAKSWKKQMEELQLRMVIRIQRAYRARRQAREIKQKALEDLHEQVRQREIQKHRYFMDRKRQEALQEKDLERHQARMAAKQKQEDAARDATRKKQQDLLDRMRLEQIAERDLERNAKLQRRMFTQWCAFISGREKRRAANRLFMKYKFLRWRHHFAAFKRLDQAARLLQRVFRRRLEKLKLRKTVQMKRKRMTIAKRYLQKMQFRQVQRVFNKWTIWTSEQLRLKANFKTILQRRREEWFQRWIHFVMAWKQKRLEAVLLVQRVYRGRLARQVFRAHRLRYCSATCIERVYRGYRGRRVAAMRRRIKNHQDLGCQALLRRLQDRTTFLCLSEWRSLTDRLRHIKEMTQRRERGLVQEAFGGFVAHRQHKRDKRAAFLRHQYESAVLIQRNYRRHHCVTVFRQSIRQHRAAIQIQRVYRGHQGRQRVRKLRWEIHAARTLQTIWRRRQARRLAEKTRAEGILLAAYKGDFTATQRAITTGYWHVIDEELNGILHLAAAAGHKRIVKMCLRHQMDINVTNKHGQTPLHLLLANLPPTLPGLDQDDDTRRAIDERTALAAYMIDHGAWHEAADDLGITPLLLSAALGQTQATEMLLERSAITDARSVAGLNAAQLAVEGNHASTLHALLASRGFDGTSSAHDTLLLLHACAGRGLIDCLHVLLEHLRVYELSPNQLNVRDDDGYTPLIYAISSANVDAVQCLLESGASPGEKDFFGRSPLHFAVTVGETGSCAIVELLAMYDVDVNMKDTDGDAALHVSCGSDSRLDCTSLLLRHGADIGANALGNHPTHIAARQGAVNTLKLLVDYGADMNIKNYAGKTPLGMARMVNQQAVVQFIKQFFATEPTSQADDSTDTLQDDDGAGAAENGDEEYPLRTPEQWEEALKTAYRMGTLAEWTHYVDAETEFSFFACLASENEAVLQCTWQSPIEFDAALGDEWEVTRSGGSGVASRTREHPDSKTDDANTTNPQGTRAGPGVHYVYHNKHTGEMQSTVPPINYSLLQDVVQNSKRHQRLRQKIRKVSAGADASAMEYMRFFHEFEAESAQTRAEILGAIKIQRHFRARRTRRLVRLLLFENKCAIDLQRAFRGRQARKTAAFRRHEHACATKIQAWWKGIASRKREREGLRDHRVERRQRRRCALKIQRLFRGHRARLFAYREKVVRKQGHKGYIEWEQARRRAIIKQTYKVWDEMELRDEYPGVYFYCHHVTRSCTWVKPKEWQANDVAQFQERCQLFRWGYTQPMKGAAIRLQALWRARQARISFRLIMKSVRLMKTSEQDYLEDPTNLVKMGNYVLFLHAIKHDYERARPLYGRLMRTMAQRGPDVPFILFSYGLFLYVTQEDDVALVEDMILRGKVLDRQLIKYKLAYLGFFRQSMLQNPHDGESNLNYAACLQWLFDQYEESVPYYLRAIAANPHKKGSMELFQDMLNRKKQVDRARNPSLFAKPTGKLGRRSPADEEELQAQYDGYEQFRRWQAKQAEEDDSRRRRQFEAERDAKNRVHAVRTIQARYRRRQAMRTINRVRLERQLALSVAELAETKAVYDRVRRAFEKVADPTPPRSFTSKIKLPMGKKESAETPSKPLSVPMARLEQLFQALDLSLSAEDLQDTLDAFRGQYGKALNVNVMDVTSFAQAHAKVSAKLTKTAEKAKA